MAEQKIKANEIETGDKIVLQDFSLKEVTASKINRKDQVIRICYDGYCVVYDFWGVPVDKGFKSKQIVKVIKQKELWNSNNVQPRINDKYALVKLMDNTYKVAYISDCSFLDDMGEVIPIKQDVVRWAYLDKLIDILDNYDKKVKK